MANETQMIQIEKPAPPSIVAELSPLVASAKAFEVNDLESNRAALERIRNLRAGEKRIQEYFEPARKAADAAKKEILAARDGLIVPIAAARSIYDRKADEYERAERHKAEVEQRRLQEVARKQEEERILLAAIAAEESGDNSEAEAIMQEPVEAPVVTVAPQVAKVEGVSSRTIWSAKVNDVAACLKFMLERPEWAATLEKCVPVLETALRPLAVAQHEALAIPGVRAVDQVSRSTR